MKRWILSVMIAGAVLLAIAAAIGAGRASPAAETVALLPAGQTSTPSGFVLAEYGGRVAVYPAGKDASPREITSIWVYYLPSADRTELKSGISAANETALAVLLEDLGS